MAEPITMKKRIEKILRIHEYTIFKTKKSRGKATGFFYKGQRPIAS
jgi:hypothetical protein